MGTSLEAGSYARVVEAWDNYDVILADSYALATAINTARAECDSAGAFGVVATTFRSWVEMLWEQYGDGRAFVTQPFAVLLMRLMLNDGAAGAGLADTPNLPVAAEKCASRGAGIAAYEAALADHASRSDALSGAEHALLDFLAAYRKRLEDHGLVEYGCAVSQLASAADAWCPGGLRVCYVSDAPVPMREEEFFARLGERSSFVHLACDGAAFVPGPAPVAALPQNATLSFALPAGQYAKAIVLSQIIGRSTPDGPVVIAAKDPFATYESLAYAFDDLAVCGAVRAQMLFVRTYVGEAYNTLHAVLDQAAGQGALLAAVDMLHAPLFGVQNHVVQRLHDQVCCDRLSRAEAVLDAMMEESDTFGHFALLLLEPAQEHLDALHDAVDGAGGLAPAQKAEMHSSLDVLGSFLLGAIELGVPADQADDVVFPLVRGAIVPVSRANYPASVGQFPDVLVLSARQAAVLAPGQCATMVVWDLNNVDYPASRRDNAVSTLLDHVGVEDRDELQNKQRRMFARLLSIPSHHVVLGRCLHDADMKELYPAAMLEEFLDVNGVEPPSQSVRASCDQEFVVSDANRSYPELFTAGEDDLILDALGAPAPWDSAKAARAELALDDDVVEWFTKVYRRRVNQDVGSAADGDPCEIVESPSQLEVYHECPRKWFVSRWLNVERPGEGFGPLERGSFIHQCVQMFYERFAQAGHDKVTQENLAFARDVMERVVEDARVLQYEIEPGGFETRYVATPGVPSEEAQYLKISRGLASAWLDAESAFLEGTTFVPVLFEYPIDQLGAMLGGVGVKGRVDRIDIDEEGNLVVVDYKGSLGPEYQTPAGPLDGKKIQTLLYAAAIRQAGHLVAPEGATPMQVSRMQAFNARCADLSRNPGCVSGAVYFSYNERPAGRLRTAGFFCVQSPLCADTLLFSGKDPDAFGVEAGGEEAFFSMIEDVVASVYSGQAEGRIEALLPTDEEGELLPEAKAICKYCPDELCVRRAG